MRTFVRWIAGIGLAGALAAPVALFPAPAAAADHTVLVREFEFVPVDTQIRPGSRVRWTNDGQVTHTVTFDNGSLDEQLGPGDSTGFLTFSSLGTFTYFCKIHGRDVMSGKVTVTNNPTSPSPSPTVTGTQTITLSPSPKPTKKSTKSPTPSPTTTSPSPSPTTLSPSPSPSPTETTASPSPIDTEFPEPTDTIDGESTGNTQALVAIGGVIVLGVLGFLIYRRTLSRP